MYLASLTLPCRDMQSALVQGTKTTVVYIAKHAHTCKR
jgi:hypothetical protein